MRTKKVKITNMVDKTFRNLIKKENKVKVMIYKTIKQCRVQQLTYLVTEICSQYMQPIKWKVKYLPYKEYLMIIIIILR